MNKFVNFAGKTLQAVLISSILTGTLNYVVDPYGAFGDKAFNMPSYSVSMNQKIVKTDYIEKNYKKYNTYIVGGSKAGGLLAEDVDKAFGGETKAYNIMSFLGEFEYYEDTINYLIDKCEAKSIILQLSVLETKYYGAFQSPTSSMSYKVGKITEAEYYDKFLFSDLTEVINKIKTSQIEDYESTTKLNFETGVQNRAKTLKTLESMGTDFYIKGAGFTQKPNEKVLMGIEDNLQALQRIVDKCKEKGVTFTLISAPTSNKEFMIYPKDVLKDYMIRMASICPYWNFTGYNSESSNYWNFYDVNHYRRELGQMMLTKMKNVQVGIVPPEQIPSDFGVYVTPENAQAEMDRAFTPPANLEDENHRFGMAFGENRWATVE